MSDSSSHAARNGSFLGRVRPFCRLAGASGVAFALAAVTLVAQQPRGVPLVTDKQRESLTELAEPWPDAATIARRRAEAEGLPIFESSEPLQFTLKADFKKVQGDRDPASTALYPATLTSAEPGGQSVTLDVQVRSRGILRRNARTCGFPPLRIEFTKDDRGDLKRSVFKGLKHVKLSTHCESALEQFVVREYLAYRTYNLVTPWSLRTRLARGTYVDAASGKTIATKLAFFIERDEDLAKRMEGRTAVLPRTSLSNHDIDGLTDAALFAFLAGDTDYSIFTLHNALLVQARDRKLHAVLYDFDLTGLVNPPYAQPSRMLHLDSVRDRLYRGPCRTPEQLEPRLAAYRSKKDEILELYGHQAELDRSSRKEMQSYVEEFFNIISDGARTKRKLVGTCNKDIW